MKLKAMHLFRVLYADPFWRWWGKKVCILAARYYLGIDDVDELRRERHGGGRYKDRVFHPLLNAKERRWIAKNREKVRGVIDEVTKETTTNTF